MFADRPLTNAAQTACIASCHALQVPRTPVLVPALQFADPAPPAAHHRVCCRARRHVVRVRLPRRRCPHSPNRPNIASDTPEAPRDAPPQYGRRLSFFPSSRVLLSAGADFVLAVLSADPDPAADAPAPVHVLKSHARDHRDSRATHCWRDRPNLFKSAHTCLAIVLVLISNC